MSEGNSCLVPVPADDGLPDKRFISMHNDYVYHASQSEPEVVFIGDSIIQQLVFSDLWKQKLSSLHCLNFGIGGNRVEHVLWRMKNGELDFNCKIKAVVLFVGTNNINNCTPDQVFEGIVECVKTIREKLGADCHIILPTLLPRGQHSNILRDRNATVNKLLLKHFDSDNVKDEYCNVHLIEIDKNIIQTDGTISHYLLHDYLHLTNTGYTKIFMPVYEKLCDLIKK